MGLSASQARLLTITAKLTDNEYESQQITNAKLRLATQSNDAMDEYASALGSQHFNYVTYDSEGNLVKTDFTMASIYDYAPAKNQYAIKTASNNVLVSPKDAKNFEETAGLIEFLDRYNLIERKEDSITRRKPEQYMAHNPKYDEDWAEYYQRIKDWEARKPPERIDDYVIPAYREEVYQNELLEEVMKTGCIQYALRNDNCYMHVLASLLGAGQHTTTSGVTYNVYEGRCDEHGETWCWNTDEHPVSEELKQELRTRKCCGESSHEENADIVYNGQTYNVPTIAFECDKDLTIYQKLVDLLWEVHGDYVIGDSFGGQGIADPTHLAYFWHVIKFDVDAIRYIEHPEEYVDRENPDYYIWLQEGQNIDPPTTPEYIEQTRDSYVSELTERFVITDPDKGQWYTNLWFMMNGQDEMKKIRSQETNTITDEGMEYEEIENIYGPDALKKSENTHYTVVNNNLFTSKDWLSNSLQNGVLTIQQIQVGSTSDKLAWKSIMFGNVAEVIEEDDDKKISQAKGKYEETMAEINSKDKRYQRQISLLDAEHKALQTEYDSVKSAFEKNAQRSFKTFQG